MQIACRSAGIQRGSSLSQFLADGLLTTDKGEVGGSSPPRPTIFLKNPEASAYTRSSVFLEYVCDVIHMAHRGSTIQQ